MAVVLTLPIGALTGSCEGPPPPPGTPSGYKTPGNMSGYNTPGNKSSAPGTPKSTGSTRRSRRANKLKTWAPSNEHPSRGSKNHFMGKCRPCFAINTPEGCPAGAMCNFCHYTHDDENIEKAVHFSEDKKARRLSFQGAVEVVFCPTYDQEQPIDQEQQQRPLFHNMLNMPNCPPNCAQCMPMQNVDPSMLRRKSAPAVLAFNPTLPFLPFPEADKMAPTPDLINRHVLAMVDARKLADVLEQNQPEFYED